MTVPTRYVYSHVDSAIVACANLIRDGRWFAVEPGLHNGEIRIIVQPRNQRESASYVHTREKIND